MWCMLRCKSGEEEEVMRALKHNISGDTLKNVFIFTYDRMKRYSGSWHMETLKLFPDYVFLETNYKERLSVELEPYRSFTRILEDRGRLLEVGREEEAMLRSLCGINHHLRMSKGFIRNGVTQVTEGPLVGAEDRIRRIDRHKRLARVEVPFSHSAGSIWAGLEIVEKYQGA